MADSMTYYVNQKLGKIKVKAVTRTNNGYKIQYFDSNWQVHVTHCDYVKGQENQLEVIKNALPN